MKKHGFRNYLGKKLRNPAFRKSFEEERSKLGLGYQIFLAREKAGLTQAELARKIGTRRSNISRLELGAYNFTVEMLDRIAHTLGAEIQIRFIPAALDKAA